MESQVNNICSLIKQLNVNDDSIVQNRKIRDICMAQDFHNVTGEDHMLKESFVLFNNCALDDPKFGVNLAVVFSSRSFDTSVENGSVIRAEMLNTLQKNYTNADVLRNERIKQFYNSLTLLGEYYNRCRINNAPVSVLGSALFELLLKQLETVTQKALADPSFTIDEEFAKLVLTQITLNGLLAQPTHKTEIDAILFAIRKCLIEVSQLTSNIKALFLMTLDLYYSKFSNIGKELENMYAKFLIDESAAAESESDRNTPASTTEVNSLNKLRTEMSGLGRGRNRQDLRINNEYIGRPLKASERLIYAQQQAQTLRNKDETEEILQEKLFEKEMQDRNNENLKIVEQQTSSECQPTSPNKPNDDSPPTTTAKSKSTKERKEDQAYFLVKASSVRQRLKAPEPQPVVGLTDWYAEVESSAQNQTSPGSVSSESTKRIQNGFHSNASNPTSPNEIRRNNQMNHSFRSIRSDYSTRSMDRVGNPRYDKYENKRHYNRGYHNHNNSGNYNNNNFQNNRNNYQHGRDHGPNHGQYHDQQQNQNRYPNRRQNSDKGQNYSNKKNDNRGGNRGGGGGGVGSGYNSNNYQHNRSYPSKSYGNRNRRQSYQHDDRSITPKPFEGENWEDN
ncbi:hypothetical protein HA402_006891 [Bradysia odoriphaga]|nr:hypothetical protein HA402_006891 [Bradysia odoriphaga]